MGIWRFDTDLDPEYPLYTRGNVGEVFPEAVTPLTMTLNTPSTERGWRRLWTDDIRILAPSDRAYRISGFFGAYAYLNLSIIRRAADLSPGTSPEEIDHQFFETGAQIPPYVVPDEAGYEERKLFVMGWGMSAVMDHPVASVEAERAMGRTIRKLHPPTRAAAQDMTLLIHLRQLARLGEQFFYTHLVTSGTSSIVFGGLQTALREKLGPEGDDLARRALSGLGDVDSAAPATAIVELAKLEGSAYEEGFERFIQEHGFRGVNEWELASPSWELVPEVVHELVRRARGSEPKQPPEETRARAMKEMEKALGSLDEVMLWINGAHYYVPARERTKSNSIMLVNEQRRDVLELARRLVDRNLLPRLEAVFYLTIDELERAFFSGEVPEDLAEREDELNELRKRIPPMIIAGEVPPLEKWERVGEGPAPMGADELRGVAGSPGSAKGRVRVVRDPYRGTPPSPGEVLVAPITDPGWTPMFVPATAVVVEVGGELSHAVIVARELGIPAVVAAVSACTVLKDGDLVEVDGSQGVVRVLERA